MRACFLLTLAVSMLATACAKRQRHDLMTTSGVCDTVPSALGAGERVGGRIPSGVQAAADSGVLIGTVTERGTRRPLPYAMVTLQPPTTTVPKLASAVVKTTSNADAGFLLRARAPATYTLAVYRIGYLPHIRSLEVVAGSVDTIHVELQFQRCTGY